MPSSAADPGTRLSGRYLLEQRLGDDVGGTTRWRAVDELLNRPVGIRSLPTGSPRAAAVMAAARRAAQIAHPRFLRILDAGDDEGHAWVASEWVEARNLAELLTDGPLPTREAQRIATAVAEGLAAAHAAGLSHGCLRPEHVLRTDNGQVKIVGLEVDAAVAGAQDPAERTVTECSAPEAPAGFSGNGSSANGGSGNGSSAYGSSANGNSANGSSRSDPAALDAAGCGAILYAALTARWPLGAGTPLAPAPVVDGHLASPRQVRGGIPHELDEIACRSLAVMPRRGSTPLQTPAEVVAALTLAAAAQGGSSTGMLPPVTGAPHVEEETPGLFAAPAEPSRAARTIRILSAVALTAGLALAGWQLLDGLLDSQQASGQPAPPVAAPRVSSTPSNQTTGALLQPVSVLDFDPEGDGKEHREERDLALDGDPNTAWRTMEYFRRPDLGGGKSGVGLIVDLGTRRPVSSVTLQLEGRGSSVEIRVADRIADEASGFRRVARSADVGPLLTLPLEPAAETRYVLVWLTNLPPSDKADRYRGGIAEIAVRG